MVHKTFRKRPGSLLKVLCTSNLRPLTTGKSDIKTNKDPRETVRYFKNI